MYPQVHNFSTGYYIMRPVHVEMYDADTPMINEILYGYLNEDLLPESDCVILKYDSEILEVEPSEEVPLETLIIPQQTNEENPAVQFSSESVLIPKQGAVERAMVGSN